MNRQSNTSDIAASKTQGSQSAAAASDVPTDVMVLEPCGPCQRKSNQQVVEADWHCKQCDDLLCHDCKSLHKIFKASEHHTLTSLHPPCGNCEPKKGHIDADYFCNDCNEYLCDECRSYHSLLKVTANHTIVYTNERFEAPTTPVTQHGASGKSGLRVVQQPGISKQPESAKASLSGSTVKFIQNFNAQLPGDKKIPNITGSAFLPDSRLLLVDVANNKLKLFDDKFNFVTEKQFSDAPWDVSVYDNHEVAVSVGHTIVKLSIDHDIKEKDVIPAGFNNCYGVGHISRDKVAVTGRGTSGAIFYVYSAGKLLSKLNLGHKDIPWYVAMSANKSKAHVSIALIHTVSTVDLKTNKIENTYKHEDLSSPHGMTVDHENNLYVCGRDSHTIHRVSPDGKCIEILLSKKDGMLFPQTISFAPNGKNFIVGCSSSGEGKMVQVYTLA